MNETTKKRLPGRPQKYPWNTTPFGASFRVGLKPGEIVKDAKARLQRLASYHRCRNFMDFTVSAAGRSIEVSRVG